MAISYIPPAAVLDGDQIEQIIEDYLDQNPPGVPDHNQTTNRDAPDAHPISSITGLDDALATKVGTDDPRLTDSRPPTAHAHETSDVTGLDDALAGKANASHSHSTSDVTGLDDALAGKVDTDDPRLTDARTPTAHQHPLTDLSGISGTPSSSTFLRGDSTWATPPAGAGGDGGFVPPEVWVLSSDLGSTFTDQAGPYVLVCDGENDEEQINQAIELAAALSSRNNVAPAHAEQLAKVQLSGGRFNIEAAIEMLSGVRLTGQGWLTELRATGCNDPGMIMLAADSEHLVQVDHLYLEGNAGSGGTCSGIYFTMPDSSNVKMAQYPDTNPDAYHHIHDLFIRGFTVGADRSGIVLYNPTTTNQRGVIIDRIQGRHFTGHGIYTEGSSDALISNVHIGNADVDGFRIYSANTKLVNVKAFYCNSTAFNLDATHVIASVVEAQDSPVGVLIGTDAYGSVLSSVVADCCLTGVQLSCDWGAAIMGLAVRKSGLRYQTLNVGVQIDEGVYDAHIIGSINPQGITTPFLNNGVGEGFFIRLGGIEPMVMIDGPY